MQTITTYKIVWITSTGDLAERDFDDLTAARDFASSVTNSILYKVQILGSIERIT